MSAVYPITNSQCSKITITLVIIKNTGSKTVRSDVSKDGKREEQVFGLTNKEFCEYYKKETGKVLSTKTFRETYIEEWYANGLIETVDSVINAKQHISYPIISFIDPETEVKTSTSGYGLESVFKIGVIGVSVPSPMDIPPKPITIQNNFKEIPKDWLKLQISGLLQWAFQLGQESGEVVHDLCTRVIKGV